MSKIRQTPPSYMATIIGILKSEGEVRTATIPRTKLIEIIQERAEPWSSQASKILKQLIDEKLLVIKANKVSLPKTLPDIDYDFYCFECHLPGNLKNCEMCYRSFHINCVRENPEKSNDMPNSYVHFEVDDNLTEAVGRMQNIANNNTETRENSTDITLTDDEHEVVDDLKPELEVICLGETRPRSRKRPGSHLETGVSKREVTEEANNSDEERLTLCTCCRLMQIAPTRHPPNLESEELCYLLRKSFNEFSKHIKFDLASCFSTKKLNPSEINFIKSLLCIDSWTLKDIKNKLANNQYKYVLELLIDILDFQHVVGVVYGTNMENYITLAHFVHSLTQDLSEIIRCPDCFRHAHDKHTTFWFAKPCTQRHEVVLARTRGSPLWPAKVLHVLKDDRHIVRFFGGKHDRAMVSGDNICTFELDTFLDNGNGKKISAALTQAIKEALLYKTLSTEYASMFSFYSDKKSMENIIESLVSSVSKSKKNNTTTALNNTLPNLSEPEVVNDIQQVSPLNSINNNNNSSNIRQAVRSPRRRSQRFSSEKTDEENDNIEKRYKKLEAELHQMKQKIEVLEAENRRFNAILGGAKKGKKLKL